MGEGSAKIRGVGGFAGKALREKEKNQGTVCSKQEERSLPKKKKEPGAIRHGREKTG